MGFVKLNDPGAAITLHVTKVVENKSGNWPDWEFHGADGNVVAVPQKACERQFARLNVASALQLVGANLKISCSDKPGSNGKLFWNLDLAGPPSAPSKRLPPPETVPPRQGGAKHIPGLDDLPDGEIPDWHSAPLPEDPDGFEQFSNAIDAIAQPAQTPRETADAMLKAKKRHDFLGFYAATFAQLQEMLPDGTSDDAVQAATATCVIRFGQSGLLP